MVDAYDLLEDRRMIDVIVTKFFSLCLKWRNLRNSSVVDHKTKNPLGAKICLSISFQLLL